MEEQSVDQTLDVAVSCAHCALRTLAYLSKARGITLPYLINGLLVYFSRFREPGELVIG